MLKAKPDAYVMIVALMSDKLGELETALAAQTEVIKGLGDHITADHAQMDDMQRTITDLRAQLERQYDEVERLRDRAADAAYYQNRVRTLESENAQLRIKADPEVNQRVEAYMRNHGVALWKAGNKIECIKGVREVTRLGNLAGWGLKETKDFCEAYDYSALPLIEEDKPRTLRSSGQIKVANG